MRRTTFLVSLVLLLGACAGPLAEPTTTTADPVTATSSSTSTTSTTTAPATSTTEPSTTTTEEPPTVITVTGGVVEGPDRIFSTVGGEVSFTVVADVADEIHVHGYDLFFETTPGVPVEVTFITEVPGIFEVELESVHLLLVAIEVTS